MENTTKKITKREMFEQIKAVLTDTEQIAFVEKQIEQLAKKNSTEKKPTAIQQANEVYKAEILAFMENGKKYTVTELVKAVPVLVADELSNQRASALLTQLVKANKIERVEEKRKAYFTKQ